MPDTPGGAIPSPVPVPQHMAEAPVSAGMVVPYITMTHRDPGKPVWGAVNPARLQQIWLHSLCQVCGRRLDGPWVVVYIRPCDYLRGIGPEPALHPECGLYSKRACPMLSGQTDHYNRHPSRRPCGDPECTCRLWAPPNPEPGEGRREGQPAEAWYEAWIAIEDYTLIRAPGGEHSMEMFGVELRPASRLRKLRKIRDAAPTDTGDQPLDLLAAIIATHTLFTGDGE
ncbi:hypothetical protein C5E45_15120 [Nocardia nova]|uniref:Uncharacterized protein n=1 Tax=Nocardia nova TaxID=37330 RepID=A0A2S6AQI2_9NOCA|nr:hypothetical protein [Nocardia nova]PPJ26647.1 hypothetical protein C5E41_17810 [Nocardia nova]PPJ37446.1 hypothetical protein C5E45_15120 [Nocardia nova]